jgi:hypothetical protein
MISPCLRAVAFALLILSFATFSGVGATVSALEHPEKVDACCDRGESGPEPMSDPCSESDCLCFSCLTLDRVVPLTYACPLKVTASGFSSPRAFCPDGFNAVIDYPPETA